MAGALVQQAHPQQRGGLHQGGELQLGVHGGVARRHVQEQHLGDGGVRGAPLGGGHAQQHARGRRVVLLAEVAVQVRRRQAVQVACGAGSVSPGAITVLQRCFAKVCMSCMQAALRPVVRDRSSCYLRWKASVEQTLCLRLALRE